MNDDEQLPMTFNERFAWGFAVLAPIVAAVYFVIVLPQLAERSPAEIEWQIPMLVAGGTIILLTIVGTIIAVILGVITGSVKQAVRQSVKEHGLDAQPHVTIDEAEFAQHWQTDIRDQEIERLGDRVSHAVLASGVIVVVALAMLRVDQFWIGNSMFLLAIIAAVVGSVAKIRAHRGALRA